MIRLADSITLMAGISGVGRHGGYILVAWNSAPIYSPTVLHCGRETGEFIFSEL